MTRQSTWLETERQPRCGAVSGETCTVGERCRSQSLHSTEVAKSRERCGKQSRTEGRKTGRWRREDRYRSKAPLVPVRVRQGAEVQGREWLWTKASVRPERMLAALATASRRHIANAFSRHIDCSPFVSLCRRANPDEETTDWRAVCGRTARTVRRAGTARAVPDPYRWELNSSSNFERTITGRRTIE